MQTLPTVLHFIICDRVRPDPHNLQAINIEGLKWSIRSKQYTPFPCRVPFLRILAVFIGGKGEARFSFRVIENSSRQIISNSQLAKPIRFIGDPHEVFGMKGFVQNCVFPRPGLYWVELLLLDSVIGRQPIRLS